MRKTLLTLITGGMLATTPVIAAPASAGGSYGVKSIAFAGAEDHCDAAFALPCTSGAGDGDANVLRIRQVDTIEGGYTFHGWETTADDQDDLWLAASLGAECNSGYKLEDAFLDLGTTSGVLEGLSEVDGGWAQLVSVPHAKSMPSKLVAANVPVLAAFGGQEGDWSSSVDDFDSIEDLYAHGEQVIADRIADGMREGAARADGFSVETTVDLSVEVVCKGTVFGRIRREAATTEVPLRIEFLPVAEAPVKGNVPVATHLGAPDTVKRVEVHVEPSPIDPCVLRVRVDLHTNGAFDVSYRLVDQWGQRSNLLHATVNDSKLKVQFHEVAIPEAPSGGDGQDDLVALPEHSDLDQLADHESDLVSGHYQVELVSPHVLHSNIDGFSVPPCPGPAGPTTRSAPTTFERPVQTFTLD